MYMPSCWKGVFWTGTWSEYGGVLPGGDLVKDGRMGGCVGVSLFTLESSFDSLSTFS